MNISAPTDLLCATTATSQFPNCRRGIGNPELDSLHLTAQNFSNDREMEGNHHSLKVNFELGNYQVTSITGIRNIDEQMDLDLDLSNADFYHVSRQHEYEQFSQEITASRHFSENLKYSVGVYFLNTDYDIFQQEYHILKQLGDAGFSEGHAAGEIQELRSTQQSNLQSLFASADYILNDQWSVDLALRGSQVERDFEHSPSRIRLGDSLSPARTRLVGEETSKELIISTSFAYKVDDKAMIYGRYSEGFLPGGFDENAMSAETGNSYVAETIRGAELGLKSDWWDDKLRVNLAYYKTEFNNKVERFDTRVSSGDIESVLDNVAEVEITGWEIEIESAPLEHLYIRTVYSHINADYNQYHVADLTTPGSTLNLSNLTPNRAPNDNLFFSAT